MANCDADGDHEIDFPFFDGQTITTGDNHRGYLGYRNPIDNTTIIDDGAINIVADSWINRTSAKTSPNLESSSICPDSP